MALCLHVCVHVHQLLSWLYCLTHVCLTTVLQLRLKYT